MATVKRYAGTNPSVTAAAFRCPKSDSRRVERREPIDDHARMTALDEIAARLEAERSFQFIPYIRLRTRDAIEAIRLRDRKPFGWKRGALVVIATDPRTQTLASWEIELSKLRNTDAAVKFVEYVIAEASARFEAKPPGPTA